MSNKTTVNFDQLLKIEEVKRVIKTVGMHVTPLVQSEPGCGKSSILWALKDELGTDEYDFVYLDAPVKDIGDVSLNIPVHETRSLEQYVAKIFEMGNGKKKVIMIDEYLKCNKILKLMLTRMILERYVGDDPLPAGSIVFATSNNQSDGVNDTIEGHVGNRLMLLKMAKPNADEWCLWATANRIAAPIRAWVAMNPSCLHSYLDGGEEENPYIFNPARATVSYVSPRSLAKSDPTVRSRSLLGETATKAALAGTLGHEAAESMTAFLSMEKDIILTKDVIKNPTGCRIPEHMAALFMMMFNALDDIQTQDDLSAFMKFVERINSREVESVFFTMMVQNNRTVRIAKNNAAISQWAARNVELFA